MTLADVEAAISDATAGGVLPSIVLAAARASGSFKYIKKFDSKLAGKDYPIETDAVFSLASSSKLVTNVAVMQCVEKGLISLASPISDVLPEWREASVLTGFDSEERPILNTTKEPITVAQLLTHTSGIAFGESEMIRRYRRATGGSFELDLIRSYFSTDDEKQRQELLPQMHEILSKFEKEPLLFEPGQGWVYGYGQQWGGKIVETLSGMSLDDYCQKNIFEPLGMKSATYRYEQYPDIEQKFVPMMTRNANGHLKETSRIFPGRVDMGGSGLCCSAPDFLELLLSLLRNDGKILKPNFVDLLLEYRLPNRKVMETENVKRFFEGIAPADMRLDHCIAGFVNLDVLPSSGRPANSVAWQGATSTFWWIDRTTGVCGFYGSQVMANQDRLISRGYYDMFEKAVYEHCVGNKSH